MGQTITLKAADGHAFDAYKAEPAGKPRGGLVVIQEIFGANSHIRAVTDSFAAQGYLAIAPALFDRVKKGVELGYDQADMAAGREIRGKISWENALKDVAAAMDAVKGAGKIGVVGYCWGGSLAWLAATRMKPAAASCYYGGQVYDFKDERPSCPTMLHFGEKDASIPQEKVAEIKAAHPGLPLFVYKDAGHGFHCDHRGSYHPASAKQAMDRTLEFFRKHIG